MKTSSPIVVGTDGSSAAAIAIRWAATEAAMRNSPLRIVLVLEIVNEFLPGLEYPLPDLSEPKKILAAGAELARSVVTGAVAVTTKLVRGRVVPALVTESKDAQMLILGSRGRGALSRALLGSVTAALTRHGHCPVAVIHEDTQSSADDLQKPVLVGFDGTVNGEHAVGVAMYEASLRGAPVQVLYAWRGGAIVPQLNSDTVMTRQRAVLAESMAGWQEQFPEVAVERFVVQGNPVRNLLERSRDAQLMVVGSRGRGGFTGMLLGSTSQALVHAVKCPIIVVRTDRNGLGPNRVWALTERGGERK